MRLKERIYSMLIVSSSETSTHALRALLPESIYAPVHVVSTITKAKLALNARTYDFLIVNSPLSDDQGIGFAIDASTTKNMVVLLMVKQEIHAEIYEKTAPYGVFTLPKPTSKVILERGLAWMISAREGFRHFEKKKMSIEQKMEEIRLVNRAKWLLISHKNMSEEDAHHYIEKQAMDRCIAKREIANEIIQEFM